MVAAAVAVCAATAVLVWPVGWTRGAPWLGTGQRAGLRRRPSGRLIGVGWVATAGLIAGAAAGAVAALLVTVCAVVALRGVRSVRAMAAVSERRTGELEILGALVAELQSGRHPAAALGAVPDPTEPGLAAVIAAARAAPALGGDVSATLRGCDASPALQKLAAAWELSELCGAPLADLVVQVARDVQDSADLHRSAATEMAGPRATGLVLAVLPVVGVGLGAAMGADPLHVLLHTRAGAGCAAGGVAFELAGLAWVRRLTQRAGRSDP